jgi:hypothetical protein
LIGLINLATPAAETRLLLKLFKYKPDSLFLAYTLYYFARGIKEKGISFVLRPLKHVQPCYAPAKRCKKNLNFD